MTDHIEHHGRYYNISDLAQYMDDSIRERVHAALAPCSAEEFWAEYSRLDPHADELFDLAPNADR